MSKQTINIGASPNDGTGTPLRTSFDYTNQNFTEIYTALGGGVALPGATTQVIFNDGGTNLAGDAGLVYNKTTDALTVAGLVTAGSATITGDLTVDTSTLKVDSTNNTVGIGNATPPTGVSNTDLGLTLGAAGTVRSVLLGMQNCFGRIRERDAVNNLAITTNIGATGTIDDNTRSSWKIRIGSGNDNYVLQRAAIGSSTFNDLLAIDSGGACVWSDGAGGTRMTLDSTGLAVGTASATYKLDLLSTGYCESRIRSSGNGQQVSLRLETKNSDTTDCKILLGCGVTANNQFLIQDTANTKNLYFISGVGNATNSHLWYSGGATATMTLDASGNLLVARTSAGLTNGTGVTIGQASIGMQTEGNATQIIVNRTTSDGTIVDLRRNNSSVGNISVTTTGATFNSTSDYRLKESVAPMSGGLARVNALKPSIYKWKSDGSNGEGFIAHELAEVVPAAVTGEKDAVNENGSIKAQGVDLSKVVPVLVAAIQELTAEVNALKNA